MKKYGSIMCILVLTMGVLLLTLIACAAPKEKDKIPLTTKSEKAREYYLKGLDLFEKLRGTEARTFFEKAISEDPDFALAYLNLSFVVPSAKEFFENLDKAKALVDEVSEGERLCILGVEAGVNAFPMEQRELYKKLVEAYPDDERAHNLLGNHYFAQQDWELAIEEYLIATRINPDFSPPYNQLGYAYRYLENYPQAEIAFKKYVELIPDDPNPYDSYAELLMKMGKYDESIEYYQKALGVDLNFVSSHIGIATNLNFNGKHQEAREQLQKLYDMARNDGERRAALFAMAVSYVDQGNTDSALEQQNRQYALAEKINDAASMFNDLAVTGIILLEAGRLDEAQEKFEKGVEVAEESDLSEAVKDNARRGFLFNSARVALKKKDFAAAKVKSEEFYSEVKAINNPFQIRLANELAGEIALEEQDYDNALMKLQQANRQNPYNFYRMALAYQGKGNKSEAKEMLRTVVKFNALNNLNYSFIRQKAQQMLDSL